MRKILLVCIFITVITVQAQEQTHSEFQKETVEFLKLTGAGAMFQKIIPQLGAMVSEANKEAFIKEANGTIEGLYVKMSAIYMAEFTQDEIKELIAFYNTDLGKKLAKKQLILVQKGMAFGQSWGMEVQAIAQKYN